MNNIETKINILYDFVYSKSFSDEADIDTEKFENPENIDINDIKIKFEGENYDDIITELFSGKFKKIDFIKDTLILKRYTDEGYSISLYISPYDNDKQIELFNNDGISSMNNNDSLFSYLLSNLVLNKQTKHIALPIINVDVKFIQMSDIFKPYNEIYNNYKTLIENEEISNILSVRVRENFFKSITLTEYIKSPNCNYKVLLFQIIHTLAVLQNKYPGFRHNLLEPSNIFVYLRKENDNVDKYVFDDEEYYIKNNNIDIKITNFGAAYIPNLFEGKLSKNYESLNSILIKNDNDYFDLHYILNNILDLAEINDKETNDFLDEVIPEKYRNKDTLYLQKDVELHKPIDLLKHSYFKDFLHKHDIKKTMSTDDYYTNKTKRKNSKHINGTRQLSKHVKSSNKIKRTMVGGGVKMYNLPISKVANNPFISNEQRRILKNETSMHTNPEPSFFKPPVKQESREDAFKQTQLENKEKREMENKKRKPMGAKEEQKEIIEDPSSNKILLKQDIKMNPDYAKPYSFKPMPTWEHEYVPMRPPSPPVPQAKMHYEPKPYNKDKPVEPKPYNKDKPVEPKSVEQNKPYEQNKPFEPKSYNKDNKFQEKRHIRKESIDFNKMNRRDVKYPERRQIREENEYSSNSDNDDNDNIKPNVKEYIDNMYSKDEPVMYNENKKYPERRKIREENKYSSNSDNDDNDDNKPNVKEYIDNMYNKDKPVIYNQNKKYPERRQIRDETKYSSNNDSDSDDSDNIKPNVKEYIDNMYNKDKSRDTTRDNRGSYNKYPPRDNRDNYNKYPPRDNRDSYNKEEYYRPQQQKNITDYPIIAEQKLYNTPGMFPAPGANHTHPRYGGPAYVNIDNQVTYPPNFVYESDRYFPFAAPLKVPNEIPLQKIYNINLGAPGVRNSLLNSIYQDALPGDPYVFTMTSLFERTQLINMMRNSIISLRDGEEKTLQAGSDSLLEYIRLLEFNPYSLGKNPFLNLPYNFLLYTASYPIRYNTEKNRVEIAKYTMALNVRIYNLNKGSLNITTLNADNNWKNSEVWREMRYYNYIRDEIKNKYISPNFISLIFYVIDKKSKINYNEVKTLVDKIRDIKTVNKNQDFNSFLETEKNKIDLNIESGVSLVALTEAPTSNIVEWASPKYDTTTGNVYSQVSTGYHSPEAWKSVLFQICYAMAVLQEKELYIRNFSMENNIFIKDLFSDPNNMGHWIYNINNIDMYVPNYGHLVLIDTRFIDIKDIKEDQHKMESSNLYDTISSDTTNIRTLILEDFKRIIDTAHFDGLKQSYGMVKPEQSILDLITNIKIGASASPNIHIKDIIVEHFSEYMHNRVGTLLSRTEKDALSLTVLPKLIKGKLVVYQSRYDEYKWAIYEGDNNRKKSIIIKDNNNKIQRLEVFSHSLIEYPDPNNLLQISEKTFRLSKDSLIDTYKLE